MLERLTVMDFTIYAIGIASRAPSLSICVDVPQKSGKKQDKRTNPRPYRCSCPSGSLLPPPVSSILHNVDCRHSTPPALSAFVSSEPILSLAVPVPYSNCSGNNLLV